MVTKSIKIASVITGLMIECRTAECRIFQCRTSQCRLRLNVERFITLVPTVGDERTELLPLVRLGVVSAIFTGVQCCKILPFNIWRSTFGHSTFGLFYNI
jgi:hypothetical protein